MLSVLDIESRSMLSSKLTLAAMEATELACTSGFGFPTSTAEPGLAGAGPGVMKPDRPVILLAGNDTLTAVCLVDFLRHSGLEIGKRDFLGNTTAS